MPESPHATQGDVIIGTLLVLVMLVFLFYGTLTTIGATVKRIEQSIQPCVKK